MFKLQSFEKKIFFIFVASLLINLERPNLCFLSELINCFSKSQFDSGFPLWLNS